jgi:hypothetical protein
MKTQIKHHHYRQRSYKDAVYWYEKALHVQDDVKKDDGRTIYYLLYLLFIIYYLFIYYLKDNAPAAGYDSIGDAHPSYLILAKMATLYRIGGCSLQVDKSKAGKY